MANDVKPELSSDDAFVKGSLDHSAGLLKGANALLSQDLPHLAYHLALLALEEIGKLEVVLMGRVSDEDDEEAFRKKFLDDHVGKIFWAFWGPSFTTELLNQKQIDWHQNLAKQLHAKRLRGLYAEPGDDFIVPADQVSPQEAKSLINVAQARLDMQRDHEPAALTDEEKNHLAWFRGARYDEKQKELVFSGRSSQKLKEFGNVRDWMKWLHEESDRAEAELIALAQGEMKRDVIEGDDAKPKWKFRIRLRTNSHTIRPKSIKAWNEMDTPIKWFFVDKKKPHELIVEFTLPKTVHASNLYDVGLSFAYRFLTALNIGTQGFFWFDMPQQTERFDESIEDIETRALLHAGRVPARRIDRKVLPVSDREVRWTAVAFGLLPNEGIQLAAFRSYLGGLTYWAKTDIHSGFEVHAFGAFYSCLRTAMHAYGDWDGKDETFADAAKNILSPHIKGVEETVDEFMALQAKLMSGQGHADLNIEHAAVMKLMTDVYLMAVLDREGICRTQEHLNAQSAVAAPEQPEPTPAG